MIDYIRKESPRSRIEVRPTTLPHALDSAAMLSVVRRIYVNVDNRNESDPSADCSDFARRSPDSIHSDATVLSSLVRRCEHNTNHNINHKHHFLH